MNEKEDIDSSISSAEKLILSCTNWPPPNKILGNVYFKADDIDKAELQYTQALQLYQSYNNATFNLSLCKVKKKQPKEAIKILNQLIKRSPNFEGAHKLRAMLRFGLIKESISTDDGKLKHQESIQSIISSLLTC